MISGISSAPVTPNQMLGSAGSGLRGLWLPVIYVCMYVCMYIYIYRDLYTHVSDSKLTYNTTWYSNDMHTVPYTLPIYIHVYIYMYTSLSLSLYIYIYIYMYDRMQGDWRPLSVGCVAADRLQRWDLQWYGHGFPESCRRIAFSTRFPASSYRMPRKTRGIRPLHRDAGGHRDRLTALRTTRVSRPLRPPWRDYTMTTILNNDMSCYNY